LPLHESTEHTHRTTIYNPLISPLEVAYTDKRQKHTHTYRTDKNGKNRAILHHSPYYLLCARSKNTRARREMHTCRTPKKSKPKLGFFCVTSCTDVKKQGITINKNVSNIVISTSCKNSEESPEGDTPERGVASRR
jgi:hypothetical protein